MSKTVDVTLGDENGMKMAVRLIKMKKEVLSATGSSWQRKGKWRQG